MFVTNPKGEKDIIGYQSHEEKNDASTRKTKHNQLMDNNVAIFSNMEKHAVEHHLHDSSMVDKHDGVPDDMMKANDTGLRALKTREEVCRDSAELKELQQALMRKDYAEQIEEKAHKKEEDKIMEAFHSDQRTSANQRLISEDEVHKDEMTRCNVEYGHDLERQIAEKIERKKEAVYRQYLEEQRLSQAEIDRLVEQDRLAQEKLGKKSQLRDDMHEAMNVREEGRQLEKILNDELERNVTSYWEKSSRHEEDLHQEQLARQQQITDRQEFCAQGLQRINEMNQTRSDELENLSMLNQHSHHDTADLRQDLETADRKLRQTELTEGWDGQVADHAAENARAKRDMRQADGDFNVTYVWGSDDVGQRGNQAEQQRKTTECSDYNRATVRQHQREEETRKHCNERQDGGENAAEGVFRKRLVEEEKDRVLEAEKKE